MDREFAIRPVIGRPPQSRPPALADAEHLLRFRLAPVGHHHALIAQVLAVRKEDRPPEVAMLDLRASCAVPRPMEIVDRPVVQPEGRGEERP